MPQTSSYTGNVTLIAPHSSRAASQTVNLKPKSSTSSTSSASSAPSDSKASGFLGTSTNPISMRKVNGHATAFGEIGGKQVALQPGAINRIALINSKRSDF